MALTTGVVLWLLVVALVFIVPQFKDIYLDYHLSLSGPTLAMVRLSDWTARGGWLLLVCLPIACGFLFPRTSMRPRTAIPIASVRVTVLVIMFAFFLTMPLIVFLRSMSSRP